MIVWIAVIGPFLFRPGKSDWYWLLTSALVGTWFMKSRLPACMSAYAAVSVVYVL